MPGKVRLADDDRDLIAQTFAAAENHEFGLGCAVEGNRRAADDVQVVDLATFE